MKSLVSQRIYLILRVTVALLFIVTGIGKLFEIEAFAEVLRQLEILPDEMIRLSAIAVSVFELLLGLLLLVGYRLRELTVLGCALVCGFLIVSLIALDKQLDIHCGCFGRFITSLKLGEGSLVINLLVLLAIIHIRQSIRKEL